MLERLTSLINLTWSTKYNPLKYNECSSTNFLIDGKRFSAESVWNVKIHHSYRTEKIIITQSSSVDLIKLISNSNRSIRFQVCKDEYYIKNGHKEVFRKFI